MKSSMPFLLLAMITVPWFSTALAASDWDPTAVAAGMYRAHESEAPTAIVITGEITTMGLTGPYKIVLTSDGRFHWETNTRLNNNLGYDGQIAWERDWNQTPRQLQQKEYDRSILETLLWSGAWSRGSDANGRLELGAVSDSTEGQWQVSYTFGDRGMHGIITIDRAQNEVIAYSSGTKGDMQSYLLSDFQDFGGVRWPALTTLKTEGASDSIFKAHDIKVIGDAQEITELLAPNLEMPAGFRFNDDLPADLEIKRAPTGHLLVHPLVDGQDVGWFIFDTGAGAIVLDNVAASTLGYSPFGEIVAEGVGGRITTCFYQGETLQLGRLEIDAPIYASLDLAFLNGIMGVDVAGIIGYGVLSRAIVEFDHLTPRIALFDEATYSLSEGQWSEMQLADRLPNVPGKFEGHTGIFKLDTGATGTVTFFHPTTERLQLLKNRRLTDTHLGGVGGAIAAKKGLMQWVELGGHRMENVEVSFATETKGVFGGAYTDGNVGTELLDPFTLVFDYQNTRIAFLKR